MYRYNIAPAPVGVVEESKKDRTMINVLAVGAIALGLVGWVLVASMSEPQKGRA